jgi:hypothetical protein
MSTYQDVARHPRTNQIERVWMLDDYFGQHQYGVKFETDTKVFQAHEVRLVPATELFDMLEGSLEDGTEGGDMKT